MRQSGYQKSRHSYTRWLMYIKYLFLIKISVEWIKTRSLSMHSNPPIDPKSQYKRKIVQFFCYHQSTMFFKKNRKQILILLLGTQTSSQIPIQEERIRQFWEYLYHCHYHDCKGSSLTILAPAIPHVKKKLTPKLLMLTSYPTITTKSPSSPSSTQQNQHHQH